MRHASWGVTILFTSLTQGIGDNDCYPSQDASSLAGIPLMPNRMAYDSARTSKTLAQLSDFGERGFWRLMLAADDFGRFEADPEVVIAQCFPRMMQRVTNEAILAMLDECVKVGLIFLYEANGAMYGQFVKADKYFRRRAQHSKYPAAGRRQSSDSHLTVTRQSSAAVVEVEDVIEVEDEDVCEGTASLDAPQPRNVKALLDPLKAKLSNHNQDWRRS